MPFGIYILSTEKTKMPSFNVYDASLHNRSMLRNVLLPDLVDNIEREIRADARNIILLLACGRKIVIMDVVLSTLMMLIAFIVVGAENNYEITNRYTFFIAGVHYIAPVASMIVLGSYNNMPKTFREISIAHIDVVASMCVPVKHDFLWTFLLMCVTLSDIVLGFLDITTTTAKSGRTVASNIMIATYAWTVFATLMEAVWSTALCGHNIIID